MQTFHATCEVCGVKYTYQSERECVSKVCSYACDHKAVRGDNTFTYSVTDDVVLDDFDLPDGSPDHESFAKLARYKYGVKAEFTGQMPNGNFEYRFSANQLKVLLQYLTNEICGDMEQALYLITTIGA